MILMFFSGLRAAIRKIRALKAAVNTLIRERKHVQSN